MSNEMPSGPVWLILGGHLSFYDAQRRSHLEFCLEKPAALVDLLKQFGIPPTEIGLVAVNGEQAALADVIVLPGDKITLYPPLGGG